MTSEERIKFIQSVLAIGDGFNDWGDLWESLWWRTDGEYAPVRFFVNCSDLFWWGTADAETLTPENLPELFKAVRDVRAVHGVDCGSSDLLKMGHEKGVKDDLWNNHYNAGSIGALLFCCRARKMRPQRPYWKHIDEKILPLFLACGPERDPKDEG